MIYINRPGLVVSETNQLIIQQLVEYFTANNMAVYTAHIEDIIQRQPFKRNASSDNQENGRINDFRNKVMELSKEGIKKSKAFVGIDDPDERGDEGYFTALAEQNNLHIYFILPCRIEHPKQHIPLKERSHKNDQNYTILLANYPPYFYTAVNEEIVETAAKIYFLERPVDQFNDDYLLEECKKRNISTMYEVDCLDRLSLRSGRKDSKLEKLIADGKLARKIEKLFNSVDLHIFIYVPSSTGIEYNLSELSISDKMLSDIKKMRKGKSIVYDFTNVDDKTLRDSIREITINDITDTFSREILIERYRLCSDTRGSEIEKKRLVNENVFDRIYDISTCSVTRERYPKVMNFIRDRLFEKGIIKKHPDSK